MPDGGEALRRIVAGSFPLAFAQAGYAWNDSRRPPLQLTRLLVKPEWRGADVVAWLEAQGARRSPFIPRCEKDWIGKQGLLRLDRGRVVLEPEDSQGAVAWLAAQGGYAIAREFAQGGTAFAHHANDEVARLFFQNSGLFALVAKLMQHAMFIIWLPVGLIFWQMLRISRKR